MKQNKLLTTKEAGAKVGLKASRIRQLIIKGVLPAERFGERTLLIKEADLELIRERPKPGPKPKVKS